MSGSLPTFSAIYSFGDSLSDAGNLSIFTSTTGSTEPVSPPYFQQVYRPTDGTVFSNGPTWVQNVSIALGLGTLAPSLTGGNDFAYGGAETGSTPQNSGEPQLTAISLPAQLTEFQTQVSSPSSNALYTVSIGANDILDILSASGLSAQQQATDISDAVANEVGFINSLVKDGAKTVLVLGVPDLGVTPDVTSGQVNGSNTPSATLDALASQLASSYNSQLTTQLAAIDVAQGLNIQVLNAYSLIDNAIANPSTYGLTNVTTPVWSGSFTSATSGTLAASGAAAQNQYLFFDHLHPTETGHQAIADLAEQTLSGVPVLTVIDTTSGQTLSAHGQVYTGPVAGPIQEYVNVSSDNLNITATTPNWFLEGGTGMNALAVTGGSNILDGNSGSTFFTGGSGTDQFYVDDRTATQDSWSTVANFHAGDSITLWGVSQSDFTITPLNGQGAAGFTGLTLVASASGHSTVALTLAGYSVTDLSNGALAVASGVESVSGSSYLLIHANANA